MAKGRLPAPWLNPSKLDRARLTSYQLARRHARAVLYAVEAAYDQLGRDLEPAIAAALSDGYSPHDADAAWDTAAGPALRDLQGRLSIELLKIFDQASLDALSLLPKALQPKATKALDGEEPIGSVGDTLIYASDYVDPARLRIASQYVRETAVRLVRAVTTETRENLRQHVLRGIKTGKHPNAIARDFRGQVGLLPGDGPPYSEGMVERFRERQLKAGLTEAKADAAAERYRQRLVKRRAENIARTEMIQAEAGAKRTTWADRQEQLGIVLEREWVADAAACPLCLSMEGERALVGELYLGEYPGPPRHPSCRCAEVVRLDRRT